MKKIIDKNKFKEAMFIDDDEVDSLQNDYYLNDNESFYEGNDVDMIKKLMYKSLIKRRIPSMKAEILMENVIILIEKMVSIGFNSKAMSVLNKAVEFINKRLGVM